MQDYLFNNEVIQAAHENAILEKGISIGEERGEEKGEKRGISIGEKRGISIGEKRGISKGRIEGMQNALDALISKGYITAEMAKSVALDMR